MKIPFLRFKALIDYLIYGNVLIGLGTFSLSHFFIQAIGLEPNDRLSFFLLFATTFTYSIQRRIDYTFKKQSFDSATTQWMIKNPFLSLFNTVLSLIVAIALAIQLPSRSLLIILPISLISILYTQLLNKSRSLRDLPFVKIFVIAFVWTSAIVLLPATIDQEYSIQILVSSIALFCFMIAEILPFDIRDSQTDKKLSLKTIPSVWSVSRSKQLAYLLLFVSSLLVFSIADIHFSISFLLASFYLAYCVSSIHENSPDYHFSLKVEFSLLIPYIMQHFISMLLN